MWDYETESWWQQGTMEAIVGTMTGTKLEPIPSQVVSFHDFKAAFPEGTVLEGPFAIYFNPYRYYDTDETPFQFYGKTDPRLSAVERVIGITVGNEVRAYPFHELAKDRVVQEAVGGESVVIFYESNTLSSSDRADIARSRSVGAASVFILRTTEQNLTFAFVDGAFVDLQTGSTWDMLGYAVDGPLAGQRLSPFFHTQSFWFHWAAIHQDTTVYKSAQ